MKIVYFLFFVNTLFLIFGCTPHGEFEVGRISGTEAGVTELRVRVPNTSAGWKIGIETFGEVDENANLEISIANEGPGELQVQDPTGVQSPYAIGLGEARRILVGSLRDLKEATAGRTNPLIYARNSVTLKFVIDRPGFGGEIRLYLYYQDAL